MFSPESSYEDINEAEQSRVEIESKVDGLGSGEATEQPATSATPKQVKNTSDESASASAEAASGGIAETAAKSPQDNTTITTEQRSRGVDDIYIDQKPGETMSTNTMMEKEDSTQKTVTQINDSVVESSSHSITKETSEEKNVTMTSDGTKTDIQTDITTSEKTSEKHDDKDPVETAVSHHSSHSHAVDNDDVVISMADLGRERVVGEVTEGIDEAKETVKDEVKTLSKEAEDKTNEAIADVKTEANKVTETTKDVGQKTLDEAEKTKEEMTKDLPTGNGEAKGKTASKKCCALPEKKDKLTPQQKNAQTKSKQQEEEECCCVLM